MHLNEAIRLFMDHRRRRAIGTKQHYQYWLTEWRDWRTARVLPNEIATVQIDDFRGFIRYLEDEHIPHIRNPHRPAVNRQGLMPASVNAAYRTLRSFWIFLDNEELLTSSKHASSRTIAFLCLKWSKHHGPTVKKRIWPSCSQHVAMASMRSQP